MSVSQIDIAEINRATVGQIAGRDAHIFSHITQAITHRDDRIVIDTGQGNGDSLADSPTIIIGDGYDKDFCRCFTGRQLLSRTVGNVVHPSNNSCSRTRSCSVNCWCQCSTKRVTRISSRRDSVSIDQVDIVELDVT